MANYVAIRLYDKDGKIAVPQDCWPIGSIYISINNVNPTKYFGGTWVAFGTGRTLIGVDTNQTEFNSVEKTGGTKTHTLTVDEMPSHAHFGLRWYAYAISLDSGGGSVTMNSSGSGKESTSQHIVTGETGGNQPHNNLQPYITVYFWKRTA